MPAHGAEGGQHAIAATPPVRPADALSSSRPVYRTLGGEEMEGKSPSFSEEIFPEPGAGSPAKSDLLSPVSPPSSSDEGKDSSWYVQPTSTPESERRSSNGGEMGILDGVPNRSSSQGRPVMLCDVPEPCLMTSSVHYGGRDDFIPESTSPLQLKKDKEDDPNDSDVAVRGEWWQGSLYY